MALNKDDLRAIEQIVTKQLHVQLDQKLAPIKTDIADLRAGASEMKTAITADIADLRGDVSEMKKDLKILARMAQLDLIKKRKAAKLPY